MYNPTHSTHEQARPRTRFCWPIAVVALCLCSPLSTRSQTTPAPAKPETATASAAQNPSADQPAVLVGAGDIAGCKAIAGAQATAKLIDQIPGTVFAAGDLAYEGGSREDFQNCYGPTWGRFKDRTRPTLGNHEYGTPTATGYFAYWGKASKPGPRRAAITVTSSEPGTWWRSIPIATPRVWGVAVKAPRRKPG
jgi:hypothetical protein